MFFVYRPFGVSQLRDNLTGLPYRIDIDFRFFHFDEIHLRG